MLAIQKANGLATSSQRHVACLRISELRHDHASRQPLFRAAAKAQAAAAAQPEEEEGEAAEGEEEEAPPPAKPAPEGAEWHRDIVPDDVLLFRYSALTFNGHRIHYDRRYVTGEEGYPGLIVHGPLIATLLNLHDPAPNLPICRRHDRIHSTD